MALDCFVGKWQEERKKDFDDLASAIGLPFEKAQFYKEARTVIAYRKDGDKWIITVGMAGCPKGREYAVRLGEPYNAESIDGSPMRSVITEVQGKFVETHVMLQSPDEDKEITMEIEREIEPTTGQMLVTTKCKDQIMKSWYSRLSV